jgi:MOSC domain-containing protein
MKNQIGVIAAIHRYPVKSMMGEELNASQVRSKGLLGDRVFSIADPATGKVASAKNPFRWPGLFCCHAEFTYLWTMVRYHLCEMHFPIAAEF